VVAVLRIRGFALPGGDPVDLYADGDRWTDDPVAGAELAGGGLAASRADRRDDADPRADLSQLDIPRAVILRGRLICRR
jgi:hypothetical protein